MSGVVLADKIVIRRRFPLLHLVHTADKF